MNDDKILDRIRKLLAMAGDTGSPNEATIAAGRARFLMDQHQVTEWDLKQNRPEDFGKAEQLYMASYQGMLGIAMARLNDVNCSRQTLQGMAILRFEGYLVDAVTAKELWLYLVTQCEQQAKKIRGRKDPYKRGFGAGVQKQVREILKEREQIKTSNGTSLVVSKRAAVTERFGTMQTSQGRGNEASANYSAGFAAGQRAGLNRQVGGSSNSNSGFLT